MKGELRQRTKVGAKSDSPRQRDQGLLTTSEDLEFGPNIGEVIAEPTI